MPNPWLKKNPFMSLWLSTAHRMAGTFRGHATALVRQQSQAAATEATREGAKAWAAAVTPPAAKKTRKR